MKEVEVVSIGNELLRGIVQDTNTHWLAQRLVKLPHFSLVNIIAGKNVVPELLQEDVNGNRIADEVTRLLANQDHVRAELAEVTRKLGAPGASRRAAEAIMSAVRP